MFTALRISITLLLLFTILLGGIYPAVITGVSQAVFHHKANGSLVERGGNVIGSSLLAQSFTQAKYFWPRPSAANYNPAASSGSNFGPMHPDLKKRVEEGAKPYKGKTVPSDLLTTSASGLDPHISPAAAQAQVSRVAAARHMKEDEVGKLVEEAREGRVLGIFGEPVINVLKLNLMLDEHPAHGR